MAMMDTYSLFRAELVEKLNKLKQINNPEIENHVLKAWNLILKADDLRHEIDKAKAILREADDLIKQAQKIEASIRT